MNIYTIYRATCTTNGKCYVGYDSKWPKRRYEHKQNSKTSDQVFYRAIRKYGWENWVWEIIYQSTDATHTLREMESFFIKENKSCIFFDDCNGYNMTEGGEGTIGYKHSDETKKKLVEVGKKGKGKKKPPRTEEHRKAMSEAKVGSVPWNKGVQTKIEPWNKGKTGVYSEDTLAQMSQSAYNRERGEYHWWNDGVIDYYVTNDEVQQGWVMERLFKKRNMKKVTCSNCGYVGSGGNMTRYHGKNCKHPAKEKGA